MRIRKPNWRQTVEDLEAERMVWISYDEDDVYEKVYKRNGDYFHSYKEAGREFTHQITLKRALLKIWEYFKFDLRDEFGSEKIYDLVFSLPS